MGFVRMGVPEDLVLRIRDRFGLGTFVECGTFLGSTAEWAAPHFERVVTIEAQPELFEKARARLGRLGNIEFLLGDTRKVLPGVVASLDGPAIFWLDSHYSGGRTYGRSDPCPLLEELAILGRAQAETCILIDDARLFLSPPPPPNRPADWPGIAAVAGALQELPDPYIVVVEDVIVSVPAAGRDPVVEYCQAVAARERDRRAAQTREPALRRLRKRVRAAFRKKGERA